MALDFPSSPTIGQQYNGYVWDGTAWDSTSAQPISLSTTAPGYNAIINGAFDIWQRGTSATINALNTYKTADRWVAYRNNGNATESRQTAGLTGFSYCGRYQRNASNAATDIIWAVQSIETSNSIIFAGKSATLSFYARAGANFSSASSALKVQVVSGTGTDQNVLTGFTGEAFPVDQTVTLTTSWQRFTVTGTVGSTVTQLGVRFNYTPVGTAGAADYFEVTGAQLEEGTTATSFRRNAPSIAGELAACQRYFEAMNIAQTAGLYYLLTLYGVNGAMSVVFKAVKRVAPTVTILVASPAGVIVDSTHVDGWVAYKGSSTASLTSWTANAEL